MSQSSTTGTGLNVEVVDDQLPVIRVIGLGGAGTNAVKYMAQQQLIGADFICANTDVQHLNTAAEYANLIPLGAEGSRGLGAGAKPEVGRAAAESSSRQIKQSLEGSDMVFIAAGMGGGTGTGSAAVVAEIAREIGALTMAVVTKPFGFEGKHRMDLALGGIDSLVSSVHSMITIPNDRLIEVYGEDMDMEEAFALADHVLYGAVRGITDIAVKTGEINVDFEDIRTVMSMRGLAMMGSGQASGEDRARKVVEEALACPLLEEIQIEQAAGVLVNVCGSGITLGEQTLVGNAVRERAGDEAVTVIGYCKDLEMGEEMRVTVIMTGISAPSMALGAASGAALGAALGAAGVGPRASSGLEKMRANESNPTTARRAATELRKRRPSITRRDLD